MDIDRLRYLVVLNDSSSMKEAAEHLHITQPALSKAIKVLEHELQEKLLVASGRRALITDKGKLIVAKARKILAELDKIKDEDTRETDLIRIGSFEVFTTYFMGAFVRKSMSNFRLQIRELTPGHLEEQLAAGIIDIGVTYIPIPHADLEFIKIKEIEMGIFGLEKRFKKTNFSELPFAVPITPVQGTPHKVKGLDGWPDDRLPRKVQFQVELMETALELCRQGLAVAYLPKFIVELHNLQVKADFNLQALPHPSSIKLAKQGVYIIKRKTDVEQPAFRKIAAGLRNI